MAERRMGGAYHPDESSGEASGEVAKAIYDRRMNSIEQALKMLSSIIFRAVRQMYLPRNYLFRNVPAWASNASGSTGKFTGVGPAFDLDYDQNRAMLNTLMLVQPWIRVFRPIAICVRRKTGKTR